MHQSIITALRQKQEITLTKEMRLSINLLRMQSFDLLEKIQALTAENPAVIIKNPSNNRYQEAVAEIPSPNDHNAYDEILSYAIAQIQSANIPKPQKVFLISIINNYLDQNLLLDKSAFLKKYSAHKYLSWIQYLTKITPAGIGAFTIQDRFRSQLKHNRLQNSLVYKIVDECWKYLTTNNIQKISPILRKNPDEINKALSMIRKHCNPYIYREKLEKDHSVYYRTPDMILKENWTAEFNHDSIPIVNISPKFRRMSSYAKVLEDKNYFTSHIKNAENFIHSLEKRKNTLTEVTNTLLQLHKSFFIDKSENIKKITLKILAEKTSYSQSTVSRALKNKTILTSHGIKMIVVFLKPLTSL